jgi:hypothetical protein
MHISIPVDALSKARPSQLSVAILADLEALLPNTDVKRAPGVPGALLRSVQAFAPGGEDVFLDGLLHGSSATPVAYVAFSMAGQSFYLLFNPLDPEMRQAMTKQNESRRFSLAVMAPDGQGACCTTEVPVHQLALDKTANRPPVDNGEWVRVARESAVVIPTLCAIGQPALGLSGTHQVFLLVANPGEVLESIRAGGRA